MKIFVDRHPGPRSKRLDDTGHFHFRHLETTSSRSSKVEFFCGFWKSNIDFPIVFHSNHAYLAPLEAGADVFSTAGAQGGSTKSATGSKAAGPISMLFGVWRSQMEDLSACEEIMSPSIAVWPQCTNVTDGQTGRVAIPTHWLASHESAKSNASIAFPKYVWHMKWCHPGRSNHHP